MPAVYDRESNINLIFWTRLNRFQIQVMRHLSAVIAEGDLTLSQFSVLEALYHNGPMSIGEIKRTRLMTGGNITVIISNLEKKSLIHFSPDPDDKRRKINALTPAGLALIEKIFHAHLQELNKVLSVYDDHEKVHMARLFEQLTLPGEDESPS